MLATSASPARWCDHDQSMHFSTYLATCYDIFVALPIEHLDFLARSGLEEGRTFLSVVVFRQVVCIVKIYLRTIFCYVCSCIVMFIISSTRAKYGSGATSSVILIESLFSSLSLNHRSALSCWSSLDSRPSPAWRPLGKCDGSKRLVQYAFHQNTTSSPFLRPRQVCSWKRQYLYLCFRSGSLQLYGCLQVWWLISDTARHFTKIGPCRWWQNSGDEKWS